MHKKCKAEINNLKIKLSFNKKVLKMLDIKAEVSDNLIKLYSTVNFEQKKEIELLKNVRGTFKFGILIL